MELAPFQHLQPGGAGVFPNGNIDLRVRQRLHWLRGVGVDLLYSYLRDLLCKCLCRSKEKEICVQIRVDTADILPYRNRKISVASL